MSTRSKQLQILGSEEDHCIRVATEGWAWREGGTRPPEDGAAPREATNVIDLSKVKRARKLIEAGLSPFKRPVPPQPKGSDLDLYRLCPSTAHPDALCLAHEALGWADIDPSLALSALSHVAATQHSDIIVIGEDDNLDRGFGLPEELVGELAKLDKVVDLAPAVDLAAMPADEWAAMPWDTPDELLAAEARLAAAHDRERDAAKAAWKRKRNLRMQCALEAHASWLDKPGKRPSPVEWRGQTANGVHFAPDAGDYWSLVNKAAFRSNADTTDPRVKAWMAAKPDNGWFKTNRELVALWTKGQTLRKKQARVSDFTALVPKRVDTRALAVFLQGKRPGPYTTRDFDVSVTPTNAGWRVAVHPKFDADTVTRWVDTDPGERTHDGGYRWTGGALLPLPEGKDPKDLGPNARFLTIRELEQSVTSEALPDLANPWIDPNSELQTLENWENGEADLAVLTNEDLPDELSDWVIEKGATFDERVPEGYLTTEVEDALYLMRHAVEMGCDITDVVQSLDTLPQFPPRVTGDPDTLCAAIRWSFEDLELARERFESHRFDQKAADRRFASMLDAQAAIRCLPSSEAEHRLPCGPSAKRPVVIDKVLDEKYPVDFDHPALNGLASMLPAPRPEWLPGGDPPPSNVRTQFPTRVLRKTVALAQHNPWKP